MWSLEDQKPHNSCLKRDSIVRQFLFNWFTNIFVLFIWRHILHGFDTNRTNSEWVRSQTLDTRYSGVGRKEVSIWAFERFWAFLMVLISVLYISTKRFPIWRWRADEFFGENYWMRAKLVSHRTISCALLKYSRNSSKAPLK